jgi:hypothetical protein
MLKINNLPTCCLGIIYVVNMRLDHTHTVFAHFLRVFFRNSHIGRGGGGRAASNQSGKSSGESEGSPDEQLFAVNNRRKPGQLTDNLGKQRYLAKEE